MFRKFKCFFFLDLGMLFFNYYLFIFSKRFLRGKNPVVSRGFFSPRYITVVQEIFVSLKFTSQNWKYLHLISSLYSLDDTTHAPAISC